MPSGSRLDHVYRSILITRFFTKGWGKPENLKRLFAFRKIVSNRDACFKLVPRDYPINIIKEETYSDCHILQGKFISPFVTHLPGLLPKEAETAHFQVILPRKWNSEHYKPMCLHLAGTGDHGFWRRRQIMAKPLLKTAGIGAILLENPFYGLRKPKDQIRSSLHNVSDIFVMGGCLILESLALFHWCERTGLGPLGITGMSMGGHMASLAATNWPKPIALVPCLSWSTASLVFTQGVMSGSINWELLENQYFSDGMFRDEMKKLVISEEDAFQAGQHFAKYYPASMKRINELNREQKVDMLKSDCSAPINSSISPRVSADSPVLSKGNQKLNYCSSSSHPHDSTEVSFISSGVSSPQAGPCIRNIKEAVCKDESNIKSRELRTSSKTICDSKDVIHPSAELHCKQTDAPSPKPDKSNWRKFSLNFNLLSHFASSTTQMLGLQDNTKSSQNTGDKKSGRRNGKMAKLQDRETFLFMRGIMDECTHLSNFAAPVDTSLIIAVCAKDDAYVPRDGCTDLADIWPGAEVRYLDAGHVSAYLLGQNTFRSAIVESFNRMKKKYQLKE